MQTFHANIKVWSNQKASFIWRNVVSGKTVTLSAELTLASEYVRKRRVVEPYARAKSARARSDCLKHRLRMLWLSKTSPAHALITSPWPSWPGWARLGGWLHHWKIMTRLDESPNLPNQLFIWARTSDSPRFVRKCMKSWLAQGSSGRRVNLLSRQLFSIWTGP